MIVYHGSIRKFEHFNKEPEVHHLRNEIDTIGFWFTSDVKTAKPFAIGTESVIETSKTEFWEDGEPKVVQINRPVMGYIYKVYIDEPNLKVYESESEDSYDLFMKERDKYCDYLEGKKRNPTWKDGAILLNREEANAEFRKNLIRHGYDGFLLRNTKILGEITDMYCIFSSDTLYIADVMHVDDIDNG
nr:hypothetical protein [Neobacillus sp. Marseille-Q6967]